jgi:hypothetical protein
MLEPDQRPSQLSRRGATHALPWRRSLRRELAWILLLKFAALVLLWALFFRGADRPSPDAAALSQRLKLPSAAQPASVPREAPRG